MKKVLVILGIVAAIWLLYKAWQKWGKPSDTSNGNGSNNNGSDTNNSANGNGTNAETKPPTNTDLWAEYIAAYPPNRAGTSEISFAQYILAREEAVEGTEIGDQPNCNCNGCNLIGKDCESCKSGKLKGGCSGSGSCSGCLFKYNGIKLDGASPNSFRSINTTELSILNN